MSIFEFEIGEEVEYSRDGARFKRGVVTKVEPLQVKGRKNFSAKSYRFVRHLPALAVVDLPDPIPTPTVVKSRLIF